MHHFLPTNLSATLADISEPRLKSYRTFFNATTDEETYGIYCWNDAISIRLMRLVGIIEIILRNRCHAELSSFAFRPSKSYGSKQSNNWYLYVVKDNTETARHLKKKCKKLDSKMPAHKVISGMTYGFWPHLLNISHDVAGVKIPWERMLPMMFPSHPQKLPSYWSSQHHVDKLFQRLSLITELRNRIAHFEPVWKFHELKDEWVNRSAYPVNKVSPAPANSVEAIARLRLTYDRLTHLLSWLSKDRLLDYKSSETHASLDWLFSIEALNSYRDIGSEDSVRLSSLTKSWGLKLELRNRRSVVVVDKSVSVGRYYSFLQPR